jgi:hypothetical protein
VHLRKTMGEAARNLEPFEEAYAQADWSRFAHLPLFGGQPHQRLQHLPADGTRGEMKFSRRHLLGSLAAVAAAPLQAAPPAPGEPVHWPELTLLDGARWVPAADRAQVVVFWSVSCPFCKRHNAARRQAVPCRRRRQAPQVLDGLARPRRRRGAPLPGCQRLCIPGQPGPGGAGSRAEHASHHPADDASVAAAASSR